MLSTGLNVKRHVGSIALGTALANH